MVVQPFFFFKAFIRLQDLPSLLLDDYRGLFSCGQSGRGVIMSTHLYSVPHVLSWRGTYYCLCFKFFTNSVFATILPIQAHNEVSLWLVPVLLIRAYMNCVTLRRTSPILPRTSIPLCFLLHQSHYHSAMHVLCLTLLGTFAKQLLGRLLDSPCLSIRSSLRTEQRDPRCKNVRKN